MDTPWPHIALMVATAICGLRLYGAQLPPDNGND